MYMINDFFIIIFIWSPHIYYKMKDWWWCGCRQTVSLEKVGTTLKPCGICIRWTHHGPILVNNIFNPYQLSTPINMCGWCNLKWNRMKWWNNLVLLTMLRSLTKACWENNVMKNLLKLGAHSWYHVLDHVGVQKWIQWFLFFIFLQNIHMARMLSHFCFNC